MAVMVQSLVLFVAAGFCEIGGGYLAPDRFDVLGSLICFIGVAVIMAGARRFPSAAYRSSQTSCMRA